MRIALVIEQLDQGGAERVVQRLARGLAERGQRVFVYCLRAAGTNVSSLSAAGVTSREARSPWADWRLPLRLGTWLRRDGVEVVHAHSCAAFVHALPAARMLGLPVIHVWHGWPLGRATREHRLARALDRHAACVAINSESLRPRLPAGRIRARAICVPNGIDLPPVEPAAARADLERLCGRRLVGPTFLSIANLRPEKDICGLLHAIARLRRTWPAAVLVCVGAARDDEYVREMLALRRALGLDRAVLLPGTCADAWRLLAGADVFCLSSRTESLPNVVLEAMSQGVPIVATRVGDVPRMLGDGAAGLLVPPADPSALAAALDAVLRDPAAARARTRRAHETWRARYTTAGMVRGYEAVYRACTPARQRRKRAGTPGAARRKSVVAMLGPAAPQIGGMVTAIDLLMSSPLAEQYTLLRCATPAPRSAQPAGAAARSASRGRAVARHALALARWAALLAHARAAVAHIHTCSGLTLYRNLLDLLVAKLLGRRVVLHIRGGQFADFCRCAGPLGRWLIQAGCAAADAVIVLSEHWRRALAPHLPGSRIHVIPNGVAAGAWAERDQSPKGLPSGILHCRPGHAPCRFLYLAALTEAKGLGDLLDAAGQLAAEGVPFELAIAGPESTTGAAGDLPRSAWRQRVARLGLGGRVRFVGPVTGAAKERLLAGADCFVHPSHSEAMPNVVLEAGAAGLPVIATAVGSLPEVLRPNHAGPPLACLLPPHDQPALSAALRSMANDPELRRAMGRALQRHIRANYDIAITAARLGRIYAALLEARPPEDGRRVEAGVSPADAERTSQCSATPRGAQTAPRAPREARGRSCVLAAAEEQAP